MAAALLVLGGRALSVRAAGTVGDGTPASCTDTAFLDAVATGGLVLFDCGPNPITITLFEGDGIQASPGTTIDGGSQGQITLSGAGSDRLFQLTFGDSLTLTNLVLTEGYASAPGGAIFVQGGQLLLDQVTVRDSQAQQAVYGGGALYNYAGTVTARDSLFLNNQSAGGGAIYNDLLAP
jgi:hypothetical protein